MSNQENKQRKKDKCKSGELLSWKDIFGIWEHAEDAPRWTLYCPTCLHLASCDLWVVWQAHWQPF